MRPIQLQMSGLQSYREMQTIDFDLLTEAGVFGIFGPTGSGKSSILDAITLALYGKVERASGGTQAIMNHAEQVLFVSFTFELTNAAGTERYRVERQFKRGSELSINGTITRFLHLKGGETIVLADKAGEVNQQVQSVLGLSMQDFTRAVVLPQGKFAEFLTLTGKDRRQMLQRLFHLESYGDQLSAKVSAKVKETDSAVKEIAAEQQGLGDASDQALAEAKAKLLEAEREAELSRGELQRQEASYEEQKQVHQWQVEKEALEHQLREQQAEEASVREKELLLQKAEQAERVRPYLEQQATASAEVRSSQSQLELATAGHLSADTALQQAADAFDLAQQELASGEGPLLLRLDQLQQALELQKELEQVQLQIQTGQEQERVAKSSFESTQAELNKALETKQKALNKQTELKEQLKRIEPNTVLRQLLQAADQAKKAIQLLEAQAQEARQERDARSSAAKAAEQRIVQLAEKRYGLQSKLTYMLQQTNHLYRSLELESIQIAAFIPRLQTGLDIQKKRWKQHERQTLAIVLAEQLVAGEACAVCGSTEHPSPLNSSSGHHNHEELAKGQATYEEDLQRVQELLQLAKELQYTHTLLIQKVAGLIQQASLLASSDEPHAVNAEKGLQQESFLAEAAVTIEQTDRDLEVGALEAAWATLLTVVDANKSQVAQQEQELQAVQRELAQSDQQHTAVAAEHKAASSVLADAVHKLLAAEKKLSEQQDSWHASFPHLAWESIEPQLEELLANERAAEELRGRIDKSIPFLDGLLSQIEELQRRALEQDKTALQLHERLQGMAQLAADKSRQLALRAPGAAVPQQIAEATSAIERLRLRAQQTKLAHGTALAEQQQAAQRHSAATEAAALAARQLAQAERALQAALADNGFASREAADAAALAPEVRREWSALAAAHREREQALRHGLAQLAAKLQGRVVSAAQWAQAQAELAAAKARAEASLEARAKAAQGAEELAVRHARWSELEARRAELAVLLERLGKLQAVLKANAFVEYLAEEQLMQVSRAASERLGELTRRRYAIEVDSGGGFVIRDDANGGVKRPVSTLSGGETFLTSLALALALSAQIQLKGEYPLEFFFLDEGFGTLDQELLDMVIGALEKLHMDRLAVGVISHVPELRARLPRKLIVQPAEPSGRGSRVWMEEL
ncbi:SMC family ATPase [Paenibacillus aestuarii]|uniref:Nuclease SbcCD subunit C n=1 Tax=Paenibacillus aestuarii TaxID=516965 RepID=A0ABW0KCM8_9BACL|nr:SMC family ATPase [Paenibacillus aestuarii]